MRPGEFHINNVLSFDMGAFIQSRPVIDTPKRRKEGRVVAGRSGTILFDEEAYDNTTMELLGYCLGDDQYTASYNRERLFTMFDSAEYLDMVFYFDPKKIYRVDLEEPLSFESRHYYGEGQAWTATLSVKPFKYFTYSRKTEMTTPGSLINPTLIFSKPLIRVNGSGNIMLVINGKSFELRGVDGYILLDSNTMHGYKEENGIVYNENDRVYTLDYPVLIPGENTISWTGNVSSLEIDPRWRALV